MQNHRKWLIKPGETNALCYWISQ